MSNVSDFLLLNKIVANPGNSFVSPWGDKRSCSTIGVSLVFYGTTPPDGYAWLETSNAPEQTGTGQGIPMNKGDDAAELPSSQQTITLNATTGLYSCQWQVSNMPCRWVRVRYTANTDKAGLTANVYMAGPKESV